jgi:hypothetical protein
MHAFYAVLISRIAVLLAHLVGLVVAVILLARSKHRAALLATVGFGLLALIGVAQIVLALPPVSGELVRTAWLIWALNCCCSVLDVVAAACLIVAIWQAVSGSGAAGETSQEPVYTEESWEEAGDTVEDAVGAAGEALEETMVASTAELDEVEEATYTELSPESPYATRVLDETMEEKATLSEEDIEEQA